MGHKPRMRKPQVIVNEDRRANLQAATIELQIAGQTFYSLLRYTIEEAHTKADEIRKVLGLSKKGTP